MHKLARLIVIIMACAFLTACAASRNEYGVPVKQWEKIPKHEKDIIKRSNQPMTFDEE